eukprot:TRINITY_DN37234_c0_g1_i1.p1 TRINITY_DN37234_c0_g1~~TRINITY_DN37234_c0_g1_i1.p1  ORF type:complete len:256 (+),score=46.86 TRINITY_DN37234_c0_g1_i1:66-833(+)
MDRNWEAEMAVGEVDDKKVIDWESLMKCEEQGDTTGMKERVMTAEEKEAVDSKKLKKKAQQAARNVNTQQPQQQLPTVQTTRSKKKEITGWLVGVRKILVKYQYAILAVVLAVWTSIFYNEKGTMKQVIKDKLWWIGTITMGMVLSLSFYDRDVNSLSAYSMLNKGGQRLPGDATADDILGMNRFTDTGNTVHSEERSTRSSRPHGLDHQLFDDLSNNRYARNDLCPCKSGLKFKSCCFDLQQRLKSANKKSGAA